MGVVAVTPQRAGGNYFSIIRKIIFSRYINSFYLFQLFKIGGRKGQILSDNRDWRGIINSKWCFDQVVIGVNYTVK